MMTAMMMMEIIVSRVCVTLIQSYLNERITTNALLRSKTVRLGFGDDPLRCGGSRHAKCMLLCGHETSHVTRVMPHVTHHLSRIIHLTSHITHHTSHITHHTSHITHHTSHITRLAGAKRWQAPPANISQHRDRDRSGSGIRFAAVQRSRRRRSIKSPVELG